MKSQTISVDFVKALLASVKNRVDIPILLQKADISEQLLNNNKARVSTLMFSKLTVAIHEYLNDESCGYYPSPLKIGTAATLVRYCYNSDTLEEAIQRYIEFYSLFDTGFELSLKPLENNLVAFRINCDPFLNYSPWVYEQALMTAHRIFCWLTETYIGLEQVNMTYSIPKYHEEYHFLFGCSVEFNQANSEIIFQRNSLKLNIPKDSERLDNYLNQLASVLLYTPRNNKSFAVKIRRLLKTSLPNVPEYERIAEELNIHPQTLRRRLKSEGCDYRQLRNEFIRDAAISHLRKNQLEIKQISYELGFSEPSAFIRSFKRWTGITPNQYRKEQQQINLKISSK